MCEVKMTKKNDRTIELKVLGEDISIDLPDSFTEGEQLVGKFLFLEKMISGVTNRMKSDLSERIEEETGVNFRKEYFMLKDEYGLLAWEIAQSYRISEKRFDEITDYINSQETKI